MNGILMQHTTTPGVDILSITPDQPLLGTVVIRQAGQETFLCFQAVKVMCRGLSHKLLLYRGPKQVGPKSYKLYMMELPDDITPEDAQKKYDEYLTLYWGSARKAYFQGIKDKPE